MKIRKTKRAYYRAYRTATGNGAAMIRADTPWRAKINLEAQPGILESWMIGADTYYQSLNKLSHDRYTTKTNQSAPDIILC